MSDQNPPTPPDGGGGHPQGGGWPPSTPEQDWQAAQTAKADGSGWPPATGQTPQSVTPGATPAPGQWQNPPAAPSPWQDPNAQQQAGYPQGTPPPGSYPPPGGYPPPGTPPPGGYPSPGGYGTPAPGGYGTPAPGTPAPSGYPQTTPYPQGDAYPPAGGYPGSQPGYQPDYAQSGGYPQTGYQQQGGYPPAGTPAGWAGQPGQPGRPPGRSNRNVFVIIGALVIVVAVVLGIVIALAVGGDDKKDNPTVSAPPVTSLGSTPAPAPASTGPVTAPTTKPAGPAGCTPISAPGGAPDAGVADIGQTVTVQGEGTSDITTYTARITLNSMCRTTAPVTTYGDPPENGVFIVANFTVQMVNGKANVYPLSFFGQTADGTRYDASYEEVGSRLDADDLAAGQQVRGNIVFDVPDDNHLIYWEPLFATSRANFRY